VGGFRYAVSHTIGTSGCKDTTMWDTIMIVPGAHIKAVKPILYDNKIADIHEIQLNGMIKNATSFAWTPSLGLNRTDTLSVLCTTNEDKTYTLSAYYGSCVEHNNVTIRHNTSSYLGINDTMCMAGNSVLLGNRYNAAMFLGWLNNSSALGIKDRFVRVFTNADGTLQEVDVNYLRYFDAFMHTSRFKQFQHEGCYPYYDIFTSDSIYNWEQLFRHPFFKTYYNSFLNNMNAQFDALDDFSTFIQTSENIEIFQLNQIDGSSNTCFTNLFTDYNTFYNNIISNEDPANNGLSNVTWYKVVGKDTSVQNQWQDMFVIIDTPFATTTYIQQVIHANSSLVEYDIRTVFVDTSTVALFYPTMQWDSSAYFTNGTSPSSSTNTYLWDFGDGSTTSTDVNPFHTFPAFNTHYIVCLTATNSCGSPSYCDTVWIDSLHIGGSFKVIAMGHPERSEGTQDASHLSMTNASNSTNHPTTNNCQLSNYPNPFDQSTIIDYEIWQTYSKAELRITNVLGQEVYNQKLNRPMDKVQIDGSSLHDGLYYYSLIVDGAVKLTRTMSVIK
jgi:PKD repeat protein